MKKLFIYTISAVLVLSLSACKDSTGDSVLEIPATGAPTATENPAETEESVEPSISLSTAELAASVLESIEFPAMIEQEKANLETFLPGIIFADIKEITFIQQALTVHLNEILVIKPQEGKMGDVMAFISERQTKLKEEAAFYPAQMASAEALVVGSKGNVAYLICHEEAAAGEAALLALVD